MNDQDIINQLGLENATESIQAKAVDQVTSIVELRVAWYHRIGHDGRAAS